MTKFNAGKAFSVTLQASWCLG